MLVLDYRLAQSGWPQLQIMSEVFPHQCSQIPKLRPLAGLFDHLNGYRRHGGSGRDRRPLSLPPRRLGHGWRGRIGKFLDDLLDAIGGVT